MRGTRLVTDVELGSRARSYVDPTVVRAGRRRPLRSTLRMWWWSRDGTTILTNESVRGPAGLILLGALCTLSRRRVIVLTEFLPGNRPGLRGMIVTLLYRLTLPKSVHRVQTMTEWEADHYAERYRIPRGRIRCIPFYSHDVGLLGDESGSESDSADLYLFASGRNSTDFDTLLAAHGQVPDALPLVVVCSASVRPRVERLAGPGVTVLGEIPRSEHDALLRRARAVIVSLSETERSAGHVRLMTAATLGVPAVASAVRGLEGYEHLASRLVRPGSVPDLAAVIADLTDPAALSDAGARVHSQARSRPREDYVRDVLALAERPDPPLSVLHSPVDSSNPFFDLLARSTRAVVPTGSLTVLPFTWRTALLGRYDVLHVHWPERFCRGRSRFHTAAKTTASLLLLARLATDSVRVVRTVHNTSPHEASGAVERAVLRLLDRRTDIRVVMSRAQARDTPGAVVIPHGHYRDAYPLRPSAPSDPRRLLYVGRIRRYKGVGALLDLHLDQVDGPHTLPWQLRVAGRPTDDESREHLAYAVRRGACTAIARFVPDTELVEELSRARAVILPHVGMENSGTAILALSASRPVIVPSTPSTEELRDEVGDDWLHTYEPPLTLATLQRIWHAIDDVAPRAEGPDLSRRDWPEIARRYVDVYRGST